MNELLFRFYQCQAEHVTTDAAVIADGGLRYLSRAAGSEGQDRSGED